MSENTSEQFVCGYQAADAVGGQDLTNTYAGRKMLLQRKLGDGSQVVKAIEVVEGRPDSAGRKEALKETIAASNLHQDEGSLPLRSEL